MILAALAAPFMWFLWIAFALLAQLIGFPLIAVLALFPPWSGTSRQFPDKRRLACFPGIAGYFFAPWENWEDGIDGLPLINNTFFKNRDWMLATRRWSRWRRVFVWSAWRNSVNNQRYLWIFRLVIDPSKVHIRYFFNNTAYFVWQGLYSALYVTLGTRYIFIGYKFHQDDADGGMSRQWRALDGARAPATEINPRTELADTDTRKPGAGFSFDLLKKVDPDSWQTPIK